MPPALTGILMFECGVHFGQTVVCTEVQCGQLQVEFKGVDYGAGVSFSVGTLHGDVKLFFCRGQ